MLNLNTNTLAAVVDAARTDAAQHPRWLKAIDRALVELLQNPWIERHADHPGLIIGSTSGKCYSANGVCGCEAYAHQRPCWHRAAARLVRLHDEHQAAQTSRAAKLAAAAEARAALLECF